MAWQRGSGIPGSTGSVGGGPGAVNLPRRTHTGAESESRAQPGEEGGWREGARGADETLLTSRRLISPERRASCPSGVQGEGPGPERGARVAHGGRRGAEPRAPGQARRAGAGPGAADPGRRRPAAPLALGARGAGAARDRRGAGLGGDLPRAPSPSPRTGGRPGEGGRRRRPAVHVSRRTPPGRTAPRAQAPPRPPSRAPRQRQQ